MKATEKNIVSQILLLLIVIIPQNMEVILVSTYSW